jgi:hypothetical protein
MLKLSKKRKQVMSMTKRDLKTGMFGVTDRGEYFVVVNDNIVYEDGCHDSVSYLTDDLVFKASCRRIMKLFDCNGFDDAKANFGCIYDREKETVHEMTISEIEKALGISNLKIKKETK